MKILVTGSSGFLGRHTVPFLQKHYGQESVILVNSKDYDLLSLDATRKMFQHINPEVVIHYAAYSGGIGANKKYPADFYFINTMLTTNVFHIAAEHKIKKLIYPIGGCSYPFSAVSPIDEGQMWNGFPQAESAGYSSAKKMGIVAAITYKQQYGLNSTIIIPGNMYGEYDNFNLEQSHVIPAMIRKYFVAKNEGLPIVDMWGSGSPTRDFVYAGDVAKLLPYFIDSHNDVGPINISSGVSISIRQLSEIISKIVGYVGETRWDLTKPDGQLNKIFDTKSLSNIGLTCETSLKIGLKKTIDWFEKNYHLSSDGLRL